MTPLQHPFTTLEFPHTTHLLQKSVTPREILSPTVLLAQMVFLGFLLKLQLPRSSDSRRQGAMLSGMGPWQVVSRCWAMRITAHQRGQGGAPVADEEAVLREAPLDDVQRAVQVLLGSRVRALGGRKPRAVHPVVDLRGAPRTTQHVRALAACMCTGLCHMHCMCAAVHCTGQHASMRVPTHA